MSVAHVKKRKNEKALQKIIDALCENKTVETTDKPLTALEKIAIIAETIQEAPLPSDPPKKGFKYKRYYDAEGGAIAWELVPDEDYQDPEGTYTNPIQFAEGMTVQEAKWYTDGADIRECVKSGTPKNFDDEEFFDIKTK